MGGRRQAPELDSTRAASLTDLARLHLSRPLPFQGDAFQAVVHPGLGNTQQHEVIHSSKRYKMRRGRGRKEKETREMEQQKIQSVF